MREKIQLVEDGYRNLELENLENNQKHVAAKEQLGKAQDNILQLRAQKEDSDKEARALRDQLQQWEEKHETVERALNVSKEGLKQAQEDLARQKLETKSLAHKNSQLGALVGNLEGSKRQLEEQKSPLKGSNRETEQELTRVMQHLARAKEEIKALTHAKEQLTQQVRVLTEEKQVREGQGSVLKAENQKLESQASDLRDQDQKLAQRVDLMKIEQARAIREVRQDLNEAREEIGALQNASLQLAAQLAEQRNGFAQEKISLSEKNQVLQSTIDKLRGIENGRLGQAGTRPKRIFDWPPAPNL